MRSFPHSKQDHLRITLTGDDLGIMKGELGVFCWIAFGCFEDFLEYGDHLEIMLASFPFVSGANL